jgi:hypothetical protein
LRVSTEETCYRVDVSKSQSSARFMATTAAA